MQGLCDFNKEVLFSSKNIKVDLMMNLEAEACWLYRYRYILDHGQMASVGTHKNCHLMVNPHISVPSDGINFRWYGVGMVWLWSSIRIMAQKNQGISMNEYGDEPVSFPWDEKKIWKPRFAPQKLNQKVQQNQQKGPNLWAYIRENFRKSGFTIHTVEGRNSGPVDMVSIRLFTSFFYVRGGVGFLPSTVWMKMGSNFSPFFCWLDGNPNVKLS